MQELHYKFIGLGAFVKHFHPCKTCNIGKQHKYVFNMKAIKQCWIVGHYTFWYL